jgi:hypothetical protein
MVSARARLVPHLLMSLVLAVIILIIDYLTGPLIEFEAMFVLPVALAVWFTGSTWGLLLAVTMPLCRLYYAMTQGPPWTLFEATINATIRIVVLGAFAIITDRVRQSLDLAREVKVLRGMLPICRECRNMKIGGTWASFERYVTEHSEGQVAHTLCPTCAQTRYRETFDRR